MKVYTEGVFSSLLKLLGGGKFRKEMRKIEKMAKDDPGLQSKLDNFAKSNKSLKAELEMYCKKYPNSPLCSEDRKKRSKSRIIDIEY